MGHVDALLVNLPADTRLEKAKLLVSPTETLRCKEWRNVINGIEYFFSGGHGNRTFESMWSHFAMELYFEGGIVAKLERTLDGVQLTQRGILADEYETWTDNAYHHVTLDDVMRFFHRENALSYCIFGKNCKHFAYDFSGEVFHQDGLGDFGNWCRPFEDNWKDQTWHEF